MLSARIAHQSAVRHRRNGWSGRGVETPRRNCVSHVRPRTFHRNATSVRHHCLNGRPVRSCTSRRCFTAARAAGNRPSAGRYGGARVRVSGRELEPAVGKKSRLEAGRSGHALDASRTAGARRSGSTRSRSERSDWRLTGGIARKMTQAKPEDDDRGAMSNITGSRAPARTMEFANRSVACLVIMA